MPTKTAYVTGGASGIGKAVAEMLVKRGVKVAIADRNVEGAKAVATELKKQGGDSQDVAYHELDAFSWDSQVKVFEQVVQDFGGRVDYVYPIAGIGERVWTANDPSAKGFVKPDLAVLDIDLYGLLYTASLAIQQMRRQERDESGFRGKVAYVASVCGFYCVPTLPIYTAAKHGTVGFTRSFGKYLPEENITMNAVCPNVIRTNISTGAFYDKVEGMGLLTPMKDTVDAFEACLDSDMSGECLEIGPKGGWSKKPPADFLDAESKQVCDMLYHRAHPLHEPKK